MKNEQDCEFSAKYFLEQYVNGCECNSEHDAKLAVQKMIAVSAIAIELLENGQKNAMQ